MLLLDADSDVATEVASRLVGSLEQPFALDAVSACIGASIGIALAPGDASDGATLMGCADVAMYRAKVAHVPIACYEREFDEVGNRVRLARELKKAIWANQLVLHYQPQLDLRTGEITAVEALVRWRHRTLGLIPPVKFLPLAEEAGLMGALTHWVLVRRAGPVRERGTPTAKAVRCRSTSRSATCSTRGSWTWSRSCSHSTSCRRAHSCSRSPRPRSSTTSSGPSRSIAGLRELGIEVSIDDFGAGVHLARLPRRTCRSAS